MAMSHEPQDEQDKAYSQIVLRAWSDASFRQRLLTEPAMVLRENGIAVPEGTEVPVHEARPGVQHFFLPARPDGLSEDQLAAIAGGGTNYTLTIINYSDPSPNFAIFQKQP